MRPISPCCFVSRSAIAVFIRSSPYCAMRGTKVMRFGFLICGLCFLAGGCAMTPGRVVVDGDLAGTFEASFDFRAEARIHLKSDHTFETDSLHWRTLRPRPASESRR